MLATAAGIGDRLVREAIWYRGQCNWVALDAAPRRPVHRALGAELGDGTAGIALFLAQLGAATQDAEVRRTARGAIGQALAHAERVSSDGLYAGRIGIAYAAARCGRLLGEQRIETRAARLARGRPRGTPGFDLLSGAAGTIVGLLALALLLDDERLARRAGRVGDDLAAGWPARSRMHGLCGLSRGASGVACALLELYAVGGDPRHRDVAERALAHERGSYDAERGDWPDLRDIERREPRGSFRPPFTTSWSHGAPGIALARLRAAAILGDERCRDEAATALATTAACVERDLLTRGADFTLADGLAGNADVLLAGAEAHPAGSVLARRAGEIAASRHAATLDGWPCAVAGGGLAPGLLHGHAGIGLFYLRLHDRAVPSPLRIGAPAA
jgi:lantibiotic modifying enzyme